MTVLVQFALPGSRFKRKRLLVSRETLGSTANRAVELELDPQPDLDGKKQFPDR